MTQAVLRQFRVSFSLLSLFALLYCAIGAGHAQANVELPVVDYSHADDPAVWATARNSLPAALVRKVGVPNPEAAFSAPFPGVFLQNRYIVVCWISCDQPQPIRPAQKGSDFDLGAQAQDPTVLAQTNVYFWVSQLFAKMESLGFRPTKRLTVLVNRNIPDPETGMEQFNNAFFNEKNWTLNFLNSQNTRAERATQLFFLPSFLDPSVAMHEATHSVFQALVGKIVNTEVMGLHEAFADYFAMAVLNNPHIGQVMMDGKPMRMAEQTLVYEKGMEAHDLGNVVMAALWKIRQAAPNKNAADKVALETVRILGSNLYASAGDVIPAFNAASQQFPGGAPAGIAGSIWASTHLAPTRIQPNLEVVATNGASVKGPDGQPFPQHFAVVNVQDTMPPALAKEWGEDPDTHLTVANLGMFPGPAGTPTVWCHFAVSNERFGTPMWFLFNQETQGVIAAYLGAGPSPQLVDVRNVLGFYVLSKLTSHMTELRETNTHFGRKAFMLFNLDQLRTQDGRPVPFHNGPVQSGAGPRVTFQDQPVQTVAMTRTVEQHAPLDPRHLFGGPHSPMFKMDGFSLTGVKAVTLYAVAQAVNDPRLPVLNTTKGKLTLIGYTITNESGSQSTVMMSALK